LLLESPNLLRKLVAPSFRLLRRSDRFPPCRIERAKIPQQRCRVRPARAQFLFNKCQVVADKSQVEHRSTSLPDAFRQRTHPDSNRSSKVIAKPASASRGEIIFRHICRSLSSCGAQWACAVSGMSPVQSVRHVPGPYQTEKLPTPPPLLPQPKQKKRIRSKKPVSTLPNKELKSHGESRRLVRHRAAPANQPISGRR